MLERFMRDIAEEMGIGELGPDAKGAFSLEVAGVAVSITELEPGFAFSCVVGVLPKEGREGRLEEMLLANLFGQGTRGAVLGLDAEGKLVLLMRRFEGNAEYREFHDQLEDFLNAVEFWHGEIVTKDVIRW